jgi:hypothetical protein
MNSGWSSDFSNTYFIRLLEAARSRFEPHLFKHAPQVLACPGIGRHIFLRHDVDVSVSRALRMAEIECAHGVRSTYYVMTASPMYTLPRHAQLVREIAALGHEVGLHFDCPAQHRDRLPLSNQDPCRTSSNGVTYEHQDASTELLELLEAQIEIDCSVLEDILGNRVESLSFHRPDPWCLRGPMHICGRVNAYAAKLMEWYLSDSRGNWREGEPLPMLASPPKSVLQLLIHPIWWGDHHRSPQQRLDDFSALETRDLPPAAAAGWDARLRATLPGVKWRHYVLTS